MGAGGHEEGCLEGDDGGAGGEDKGREGSAAEFEKTFVFCFVLYMCQPLSLYATVTLCVCRDLQP